MTISYAFDNSKKSSDKWEHYLPIYQEYLNKHRKENMVFVEVGVQKGGSLEMWAQELCSKSTISKAKKIIGIDIDPECAKLDYSNYEGKVEVVIGDQSSSDFWDDFLEKNPVIDFFIDDGGHFMDQQILTFEKVFPHISTGGIYICEDTHTSYMSYNGGGLGNPNSFIEYSKLYIDILHKKWWESNHLELNRLKNIANGLSSIHFYDSMIVFEKLGEQEIKRIFPNEFKKD